MPQSNRELLLRGSPGRLVSEPGEARDQRSTGLASVLLYT